MKQVLKILAAAAIVLAVAFILGRVLSGAGGVLPGHADEVEVYVSSVDQDQDGIDDQTDILESAIAYVGTKPRYKSKYYAGGYPDDGYGVCTDVVANALRGAGYDLKELVSQDIREHPESYDIEEPDSNIDFRRVRNLRVYFANTAISLTTDPADHEEWQGGDIVVFSNHVGIVSNKRNSRGVTYVIHHASPLQVNYEEDILERWGGIVGHYRVS